MGMSKEKRNQDSPGTVRWSVSRATITFVLYAASVVQIGIILKPFVDMIPDTKDFVNLILVAFHIYFVLNYFTIRSTSGWVFWMSSYLMLQTITVLFVFYEDILL